METSLAAPQTKGISFFSWLKGIVLVGVAAAIGAVVYKLAFKKSQADKLQEAQDAADKTEAINLSKSSALKISKISDISKVGMGAAEGHNQFPYTPAQVADMVASIHKVKTFVGHGNGSEAIAVINSLPSKFSVNNMGLSFQAAYGEDLFSFLKSNVSDAGLAAINEAIKEKPDFVKLLPASDEFLKKTKQTLTL
ncbi:MAG: hypothetical protein ACHQII_01935 [Bacteroidia bacterium]